MPLNQPLFHMWFLWHRPGRSQTLCSEFWWFVKGVLFISWAIRSLQNHLEVTGCSWGSAGELYVIQQLHWSKTRRTEEVTNSCDNLSFSSSWFNSSMHPQSRITALCCAAYMDEGGDESEGGGIHDTNLTGWLEKAFKQQWINEINPLQFHADSRRNLPTAGVASVSGSGSALNPLSHNL